MSYQQTRDDEHLRQMESDFTRFLANYHPGAPTVMLLIGGMASALRQATATFDKQPQPPYDYETEWLAPNIMCGAAEKLAMQVDMERNHCITVACGAIGLMGVTPYAVFQQWCQARAVPFNYLVLAWDWRQRPEAYVALFTNRILPSLRARILDTYNVDFFKTEYYLMSHSFGGLVLKLLLNAGGDFVQGMRRAITVAAPFYGYGSSLHFYFAGFSYLADFYSKRTLAQIIGSFPGPYTLMFLDGSTYDAAQARLNADADYPLGKYPSLDAADATQRVDPYAPGANRYPDGGWVDMDELAHARATRIAIAAPLPPDIAAKLFHVRGVQTRNGSPFANTIVRQTWQTIPAGFNPDTDNDPIQTFNGPGDDTIPAWSARLAATPDAHVITVAAADVEHMTLMDNPAVLTQIGRLIDGAPMSPVLADLEQLFGQAWGATSTEAEVAAMLRRALTTGTLSALRAVLADISSDAVRQCVRRIMKDLLKAPRV